MEEIISLNGSPFTLWYDSLSDRQDAVTEAYKIGSLAFSCSFVCPSATANVGDTITLSVSASGGSSPYTIMIYKVIGNTSSFVGSSSGLGNGQVLTSYYKVGPGDAGTTLVFGANAGDSTNAVTGSNRCSVSIGTSTTPTPTPSPYSTPTPTPPPYTTPTPPPTTWTCSCPNDGTNYCVLGRCVPKTYVTYGIIGVGAIFLLSVLK